MSERLIPNCENCSGFADDHASRPTRFTLGDGVVHVAPDMWLASRARRIEQEQKCGGVEAHRLSLHAWAKGCALGLKGSRNQRKPVAAL